MVRVLVIKPSSLGDIIHAAGAVAWIARSSDEARIAWVVNDEYASFVREFPGVADVLPFPRRRFRLRGFPLWIPEAMRWLRTLRGFDIAIDFQGLQRSALMARLSGAKERFGPRGARELGRVHYNRPVDIPVELRHAIDRALAIAASVIATSRLLGVDPDRARGEAGEFRLPIPDAHAARSREVVPEGAGIIALCPGTRWESKTWPLKHWSGLLRGLRSSYADHRFVLIGAPGEHSLAQDVISASGGSADPRVINLAGGVDLWGTAALLARAGVAVAMDSAPLHLAAAVGTKTVGLFGPTDPFRVAPSGPGHVVLRRGDLDCLACYERRCPLPERLCLPGVEVEHVLGAVARALSH